MPTGYCNVLRRRTDPTAPLSQDPIARFQNLMFARATSVHRLPRTTGGRTGCHFRGWSHGIARGLGENAAAVVRRSAPPNATSHVHVHADYWTVCQVYLPDVDLMSTVILSWPPIPAFIFIFVTVA